MKHVKITTLNLKTLSVRVQKFVLKFIKTPIFTQKSRHYNSSSYIIIKSGWNYIRLNNHFSVFLCWCHVSVAANGFQKLAILLLKVKFLPNLHHCPSLKKQFRRSKKKTLQHLVTSFIQPFAILLMGMGIGQFLPPIFTIKSNSMHCSFHASLRKAKSSVFFANSISTEVP